MPPSCDALRGGTEEAVLPLGVAELDCERWLFVGISRPEKTSQLLLEKLRLIKKPKHMAWAFWLTYEIKIYFIEAGRFCVASEGII